MPELLIEPVWSWPLVLVVAAALVAVVLLTYPQRVAHLPPVWRRLLLGLRLATALLLIFAMLRPSLRYSETDKQAAQFVVLMDASRSMTISDGPGGLTRRQALVRGLQEAEPKFKALSEQAEVRWLDFADTITPVDAPADVAEGRFTAIGTALDELRREDAAKRLVGILLLSDGAERTVGEDQVDPRTAARRFAEQRGVPIHTVTYGSAELTGAGLDIAIENVVVDPLAFEKKTVPVRFQLRASGAQGKKVKLRLLLEQTTAVGTSVQSTLVELPLTNDARPFEEVEVRGNRVVLARELSFVADRPGEHKLVLEAVPLEGELKLTNNRFETVISVLKGGLKVAYVDAARSVEQKFIRRLNENARIQLDVFLVPGGRYSSQARIDPALFRRDGTGARPYDVYLIGDVPAAVFQQGGVDLLQELLARCREGAGLAMLGGTHNFGPGGYAGTPIAPLLPVTMSPAERVEPTVDPPAAMFLPGPLQVLPGPDGRAHYVVQLGVNSEQVWRSLPPLLGGANKLTPVNPAVNILAMTAQREPLLLAWDTGFNRVVAFGVNDTWRWWTHGRQAEHQRFWEQLLLWLAHMENESDQPVWARVTPRNFSPGDRVTIVCGARNEQHQPVTEAQFQVEVINPAGETTRIAAQRSGEEFLAEFAGTTDPGDYTVIVTGQQGTAPLGPPARTRFIVDSRDPELDNPAADPDLMAEIATLTGAVPIPPEGLPAFLDDLLREGLSTEVTRFTQFNLWDGWPLLLMFVLLLTTEWFVRKRRGLV